jgi:hypothetical protein
MKHGLPEPGRYLRPDVPYKEYPKIASGRRRPGKRRRMRMTGLPTQAEECPSEEPVCQPVYPFRSFHRAAHFYRGLHFIPPSGESKVVKKYLIKSLMRYSRRQTILPMFNTSGRSKADKKHS